jgi:ATP diphosphatase
VVELSSINRLLEIMAQLRDPEKGCPWDRKQTYKTIVPYTLEEAYEVADAIEREDFDELKSELGDLLFQVVFYSQIAKEEGRFTFDDVAADIADKMYRRHPHVFADANFETEEELGSAWEAIKAQERDRQPDGSALAGVTQGLPALMRAQKLTKKASKVGFDWLNPEGAFDKMVEEVAEVREAWDSGDRDHLADELGDILFVMTNIIRKLGFESEEIMRAANNKFERRFRAMEQYLAAQGHDDMTQLELEQMESAWQEIKKVEKKNQ